MHMHFAALFTDKYRNLHTVYACATPHRKKKTRVLRNLHSAQHVVENNVR